MSSIKINFKFFLIFLLIMPGVVAAETYRRSVKGDVLKVNSPVIERVGSTVYFRSAGRRSVNLNYGTTKITAKEAVLQETKNKIFLKGGFYSQYLDNEIVGENLTYNPFTNFYDAKNVTVKTKRVTSQAESFSFYGEKISLKNASFGLDLVKLDIDFGQLDLYPGWIVAQHTFLKVFSLPILYVPTLVADNRRNAYRLPDPLPEIGSTGFRGNYWRWNTHYYLNEWMYGNIQFGRAKEKGAGYGFQQIIRFSDYDQFTYINDNWQYDRTQELYSFEHSFIELPRKNKKKFTFNELLTYNEEIKDLPANSIRFNKMRHEEINDEILNRTGELIYEGNFDLPWHSLHLYTKDSYANIEEINSAVMSKKYELINEIDRKFTVPLLGDMTPGLGYNTVKYSEPPYSWHRMYDYLSAKRGWWIFEAEGKITDYLDEKGGSPFRYDQKYEVNDNIRTKVYVNLFNLQLGQSTQYSTYNGRIYDIMYYLRYKTSSWVLKSSYSLRREFWSAGIEFNIM